MRDAEGRTIMDFGKMVTPAAYLLGAAFVGVSYKSFENRLEIVERNQEEIKRSSQQFLTADRLRIFALQLQLLNGPTPTWPGVKVPDVGEHL